MTDGKEFREIGHSGGKYAVNTRTDENGKRSFSLGIKSSSPFAQSIVTVQLNFQGEVLGFTSLEWAPDRASNGPSKSDNFPVFLASDREGYFGHQCRRCNTYWRSDGASVRWLMICPNCRLMVPAHQFLTDNQLLFLDAIFHKVIEATESAEDGDSVIDMDKVADEIQDGKAAPDFYYSETSQQCKFRCEKCRSSNDIIGKFGYCSYCGYRNNLQLLGSDFDEDLSLLDRGAENCVKLLVSSFDSCCKDYLASLAQLTPMTPSRRESCERLLFHNAERTPKLVREYFDIRLLKNFEHQEIEILKLMFHRRHVYEHKGGVADQRYLDESGDDSVVIGQSIREVRENVMRLRELLYEMAVNFDEGFHSIFSPNFDAINAMNPTI